MIRSSLWARWAVALLVVVTGSASLPAVDLYIGGWNNFTQKPVFGKLNSSTGVYSVINTDVGTGQNYYTGLAWNPNIGKLNTLTDTSGALNSISTLGVVGSQIATGLPGNSSLAYDTVSASLYSVSTSNVKSINPSTGASTYIGDPRLSMVWGTAFINGTLFATANDGTGYYFGSVDLSTGAFNPISTSSGAYSSLMLAYDGTTLYGLQNSTLYSVNPATGATTSLISVSGLPYVTSMSALNTVPEPSTYALAAIATGVMAAIARRRKARIG